MRSGVITVMMLLAAFVACQEDQQAVFEVSDLASFVRPHVGTAGYGNVFVGASWPRGMVKVGPNTIVKPGSMSGYDFNNDRIKGFVHSHLEGPGGAGNGYNRILVMPYTGSPALNEAGYSSEYSHEDETTSPDYYSVDLKTYGIVAEVAASRLVGLHRYTFPGAERAGVLLDLTSSLGQWLEADFNVVGQDTIEGFSSYQTNGLIASFADLVDPGTGISTVYFSLKLDKEFDSVEEWNPQYNTGVSIVFSTSPGEKVEMRVGISYISVEQARLNREEISGQTFDDVRAETRDQWNRLLSRVKIDSDDQERLTRFYTAFYHSMLAPADYTEGTKFFSGADGAGQTWLADGWRYYTDDWCMWDTYRTSHPWFSIIQPEVNSDMIQSIVHTYEAGGWMQKCTWNATGDSRCMTANPQFCVIADGYLKGYEDFDVELAWEGMYKGSMQDSVNPMPDGMCGYFNRGTPPDYVDLGFVSMDCDMDQSASMTLEHAHNDWCVARVAEKMGRAEDAEFFYERAKNYRNHFNAEVGFMVPKLRDGSWLEDFDPTAGAGFCEADSWKYTWSVPHDVCGLIDLMGGNAAFVDKLDQFFQGDHFAMDNQPDFHVPWLYAFAGAASRTQETVSGLLDDHFGIDPEGLPGNDDAGSMSAWAIFASLGFYPVAPGSDTYVMNSPEFEKVTLFIDPEGDMRTFVIEARDASPVNRYIQSAVLNGRGLDMPSLRHADIVAGGTLVLQMGPEPSGWGAALCGE